MSVQTIARRRGGVTAYTRMPTVHPIHGVHGQTEGRCAPHRAQAAAFCSAAFGGGPPWMECQFGLYR